MWVVKDIVLYRPPLTKEKKDKNVLDTLLYIYTLISD